MQLKSTSLRVVKNTHPTGTGAPVDSFFALVMAANPWLYYRMNRATSYPFLADSSGNGFDPFFRSPGYTTFNYYNEVPSLLSTEPSGQAHDLTENRNCVITRDFSSDTPRPSNSIDWTAQALFRVDSEPSNIYKAGFIMSLGDFESPALVIAAAVTPGKFTLSLTKTASTSVAVAAAEYSYGTVLFVQVRYTASTGKIEWWINGTKEPTEPTGITYDWSVSTYYFGRYHLASDPAGLYVLPGVISEIALFLYALDDTTINNIAAMR